MSDKLGEGIQYRTFAKNDERVRKEPISKRKMYGKFAWRNKLQPWRLRKAKTKVDYFSSSRVEAKRIVDGLNADALKTLGDPCYTKALVYEQNRAVPRFPGATSDIREIASDYANIQKELWRNGCHDPVFYFMSATGQDQDGNTVLMDFHEITRDKQVARRHIENRTWQSQDDYNWRLLLECISETSGCKTDTPWDITELPARIQHDLSKYREECDEVFRKELSPEKLEEIWGVV